MTPELILGSGALFGLLIVCLMALVNIRWMTNQVKWQEDQDKAIIKILDQLSEIDK